MTSTASDFLAVGRYSSAGDPRDALCGADRLTSACGSGRRPCADGRSCSRSTRRSAIEPLRGNVDTRLRKRGERGLDAVVLGAAGLDRLGLASEIGHRFDPEQLVPEAGQGAVALQVRADEEALVGAVDNPETRRCVEAERACARESAGCLAPVAAHHDGSADGARRRGGRKPGSNVGAAQIPSRSPTS